ncbi:MAG: hypothetical protein QG623_391 [Patescibacteria group bacterium]|nr:hypothetical protein [Patescibacteria group bacterium]
MTEALEIYRPILGSGAEELAECAVRVSETLGLPDGCGYLRWGESPKVGLAVIAGGVGLELYEQSFALLFSVTKAGINREDFELRKMITWGWDLGRDENGKSRSNPSIELAENPFIKELPKAGNGLLWKNLSGLTSQALRNRLLDARTANSIRTHTMRRISLVGLSNTSTKLSYEELKARRKDLAALIPEIRLGPMQIRYGEPNLEDYGYLAVE